MKLPARDLEPVRAFLVGEALDLPDAVVEHVELGVWIFDFVRWPLRIILGPSAEFMRDPHPPFLVTGRFGASTSRALFAAFREGLFPYLLVRTESWEILLRCNGAILTEHCEEDLDAIRAACERLRQRCASGAPSV